MSARLLSVEDWRQLALECGFQPATMASCCGVSLKTLERFFQRRFGKTPIAWARELRGQTAAQLLAQGHSNKAVALDLKFANESHLCHEFRKLYGAPPQSFAPAAMARRLPGLPNGDCRL